MSMLTIAMTTNNSMSVNPLLTLESTRCKRFIVAPQQRSYAVDNNCPSSCKPPARKNTRIVDDARRERSIRRGEETIHSERLDLDGNVRESPVQQYRFSRSGTFFNIVAG